MTLYTNSRRRYNNSRNQRPVSVFDDPRYQKEHKALVETFRKYRSIVG